MNQRKRLRSIGIRLAKLINVIKSELISNYDKFGVEIVQLYYDDNFKQYADIKREYITHLVCI